MRPLPLWFFFSCPIVFYCQSSFTINKLLLLRFRIASWTLLWTHLYQIYFFFFWERENFLSLSPVICNKLNPGWCLQLSINCSSVPIRISLLNVLELANHTFNQIYFLTLSCVSLGVSLSCFFWFSFLRETDQRGRSPNLVPPSTWLWQLRAGDTGSQCLCVCSFFSFKNGNRILISSDFSAEGEEAVLHTNTKLVTLYLERGTYIFTFN